MIDSWTCIHEHYSEKIVCVLWLLNQQTLHCHCNAHLFIVLLYNYTCIYIKYGIYNGMLICFLFRLLVRGMVPPGTVIPLEVVCTTEHLHPTHRGQTDLLPTPPLAMEGGRPTRVLSLR